MRCSKCMINRTLWSSALMRAQPWRRRRTETQPDHLLFGEALWASLVYFFSHLGVSFILSTIIATPDCDGRARDRRAARNQALVSNSHAQTDWCYASPVGLMLPLTVINNEQDRSVITMMSRSYGVVLFAVVCHRWLHRNTGECRTTG